MGCWEKGLEATNVTVDGYCWWSNKTIEMRLELGSQWIPSTLGLMFLQRLFWARIIKPKGVLEVLSFHDFQAWKKLQFTNCSMKKMRMFFSFVDSQQIVPISLKSFQNWCQHIICLNKLKRVWRHVHFFGGYIDNWPQDSGCRRDCGGDGSHWSRWQSGESPGKKREWVYNWLSEELIVFTSFFLQECCFFSFFLKLRWIAILIDLQFFSRLLLPRTSFFRFLNARKSYGEHHEVSWQGMVFPRDHGWVGMTKTGDFFKSENKRVEIFDTSVLPQLQSPGAESLGGGYRSEPILQFLTAWRPRPLVKHCWARTDFSS